MVDLSFVFSLLLALSLIQLGCEYKFGCVLPVLVMSPTQTTL